MKNLKVQRRLKRKAGIKKTVRGTIERPRVAVYRSNQYIYAQIIDDVTHKTIVSFNDKKIAKGTKVEKAKEVGKELGALAKKAKIKKVVFDRSGYKYHGRVQAVADGLREAGIEL